MAQPQAAICAAGSAYGLFLTASLAEGPAAAETVRQVAAALPDLTAGQALRQQEPGLVGAIGFGAAAWTRLFGEQRPAELSPFEPLADGPRRAPSTPGDLFLHVHSPSQAANFALARQMMTRLGAAVRVVEEIHGFRTFENRDLTGFVDGTENPEGDERPQVALVGAADPEFAGGSYVDVQRYLHDLGRWEELSAHDQEAAVGRTKADDQELPDEVKPPTAHIARVVIKENGEELQILRHSLPYGTTSASGLYFLSYGSSPEPFRKMLRRMVLRDREDHYDRLLDFTRPVTGASFFCPSVDFLTAAAKRG